jgi:hypothetical protein
MNKTAAKTSGHYTLKIVYDNDPPNPREEYDNFGKMTCWHKRYDLGDKPGHKTPKAFLTNLVRDTVTEKDIITYVIDGKADSLKLEYIESTCVWELISYDDLFNKWYETGTYPDPLEKDISSVCDGILENMSSGKLIELAKQENLILPLYLLDHSGISISTQDFNDKWDSGQIGWTYASNTDIIKEYGDASPENVEKALQLLNAEVKTYEYFLRGECYGFQLFKDGVEDDSCWGFLGSFDEAKAAVREYISEEAAALIGRAEYGGSKQKYDSGSTLYPENDPDSAMDLEYDPDSVLENEMEL